MRTEARFPRVGAKAGQYESFHLKATRPGGGLGIWIRYTVHKPPNEHPTASLWVTLFGAEAAGPRATKATYPAGALSFPADAYIKIGEATLEPGRAHRIVLHRRSNQTAWRNRTFVTAGVPNLAFRYAFAARVS